jgi:AcrR family transcriptional regulator
MFNTARSAKSKERKANPLNKFADQASGEGGGRGEATLERILETAVGLFRERGFDDTTMRAVAEQAHVALGLTYHYFPSKEAVVMAYYERVQTEHRRVVEERVLSIPELRERLTAMIHTKLDILRDDRRLLGAVFRYTGSPEHPLSFLGEGTRSLRDDCVGLFREALEGEPMPEDLRRLMPMAIWALHMGVLLYFLYDKSEEQQRTRRLVDGSIALTVSLLKLVRLPLLAPVLGPVQRRVVGLLADAGLV